MPGSGVTAPTNVPVLFKADYQVTRRTTAWLQQDAAMERTRRYFQTHPELWGAEDDMNWGIMTSVHKRTQFLNQKTMTMKVMHGWLATNHVRLMRGEITADENKCTFCGCTLHQCSDDGFELWERLGKLQNSKHPQKPKDGNALSFEGLFNVAHDDDEEIKSVPAILEVKRRGKAGGHQLDHNLAYLIA